MQTSELKHINNTLEVQPDSKLTTEIFIVHFQLISLYHYLQTSKQASINQN